jgi:hypothetical protein
MPHHIGQNTMMGRQRLISRAGMPDTVISSGAHCVSAEGGCDAELEAHAAAVAGTRRLSDLPVVNATVVDFDLVPAALRFLVTARIERKKNNTTPV